MILYQAHFTLHYDSDKNPRQTRVIKTKKYGFRQGAAEALARLLKDWAQEVRTGLETDYDEYIAFETKDITFINAKIVHCTDDETEIS